MPRHVYLFSGASAVGKTSALKALLPLLEEGGAAPCVCKIDCLKTGDGALFQRMRLPCVTGTSARIIFWSPTCRNSGSGRTGWGGTRLLLKPPDSATAVPRLRNT